ncbi:hypothetical protein ILYODFUR_032594 [Ilyodon furcidens]|uniref:Uncharacterized protein n=1 Tax=Ilyodon furcidens TaxID=33524 RepID=A0ABV0U0Q2_9TELE
MPPRSSGAEGSRCFPLPSTWRSIRRWSCQHSEPECLPLWNPTVLASSSCNFQSWLQVLSLDPASVKELKLPKKPVWFEIQLTAQSIVLRQVNPAHPPSINSNETSPGKLRSYKQIYSG